MERGFSLIETIIYLSLIGLIIGGAVAASYSLIEGSGHLDTNAATQEEGSFVIRKIDWALAGASRLDFSGTKELAIHRYDGLTVVIKQAQARIVMSQDGGATFLPLTSDQVAVTDLVFQEQASVSGAPPGVSAAFTIGSSTFRTTRYLQK